MTLRRLRVTRRPSRATDLYAALYTAPTPFFAHARGTHTREILSVMEAAIQRRRSILSWNGADTIAIDLSLYALIS
jgi:hypothetical protein